MDEVGVSGLGVFIKVEKPDEIESTSESDSVVFIKEEKPDETDSTYLIDDDFVNEEENTEDTHTCEDDSTAPQRVELYHQSLQEKRIITRKRRKKALTATDRSQPFPQRRKLKNENTSYPATQSSPYENNNLSVLNHNSSTSADTTMRIPKVTIKQEKGSLFYCGGLIPEQEEATFVPEEGSEMNHIKQEEEIILSDDVPKVGVKQEEGSLFYCGSVKDAKGNVIQTDSNYHSDHGTLRKGGIKFKRPQKKRSVMRKNRELGKSNINCKDGEIPSRSLKQPCKESCKKKCRHYFSEEQRQMIHNEYWSLSYVQKREFLTSCFTTFLKARETATNSRRKYSRKYYLRLGSENIEVCKLFLQNTLDIGAKLLRYTEKNVISLALGTFPSDRTGKKPANSETHSQCHDTLTTNIRG